MNNNRNLVLLGLGVIVAVVLAQQAPFHNPQTGRVHGDYPHMIVYRANDTVTGTLPYRLVSGTGSPSKAVVAPVNSQAVLGICMWNCGTTGDAAIARIGDALCEFDGPTDVRNLVVPSTTDAGKCHDSGIDVQDNPWPTTNRIVGVVGSTNVGTGTYLISMYPNGIRGHLEGIRGSVTHDFPSVGGGNCSDVSFTVTGAVVNDPVIQSHPTSGTRGQFNAWVSAADTVTIRHCSINGVNDPPSATYNVVVVK